MKHFKTLLLVTLMIIAFAMDALPQIVVIGQSSEWDATAFNNGRRIVRDCRDQVNGYNHYVWHSQNNPVNAPNGNNCDIFYACTDDFGAILIAPTNLTGGMGFWDNRYPSIAIENFHFGGANWRTYNTLHIVWQCKQGPNALYEIMYGSIAIPANPPVGPVALAGVQNLSQTAARNSLVPAIDINHYDTVLGPGFQHIHVVWQEENVPHVLAANASDIFYTRSVNSGVTFNGPATGGLWDNITNTPRDSQMPSIACAIDTFYGFPLAVGDCMYPSDDVHVAYNENTIAGGVHVYYRRSQNDGAVWLARQDITVAMGGGPATCDGYPNISCDMLDNVHIVYMINVAPHSPFATGYLAGISPNNIISFPGPDPGMYGTLVNNISYWSSNPGANPLPGLPVTYDREFPTAALDRYQNLTINWHECQMVAGVPGDYEVMRDYCFNLNPPARPLVAPVYGAWAVGLANDSWNAPNEDIFPNLAHKKVSMYLIRVAPFPGFTEIWNKVMGLGVGACTAANPKNINMLSNTQKDPAI